MNAVTNSFCFCWLALSSPRTFNQFHSRSDSNAYFYVGWTAKQEQLKFQAAPSRAHLRASWENDCLAKDNAPFLFVYFSRFTYHSFLASSSSFALFMCQFSPPLRSQSHPIGNSPHVYLDPLLSGSRLCMALTLALRVCVKSQPSFHTRVSLSSSWWFSFLFIFVLCLFPVFGCVEMFS